MLKTNKLPKEVWAKIVAFAVNLSNQSPAKSVWGKTPQRSMEWKKAMYLTLENV